MIARTTPERFRGFSLLELLIVVVIIAVLVGVLASAMLRVRVAAARTSDL